MINLLKKLNRESASPLPPPFLKTPASCTTPCFNFSDSPPPSQHDQNKCGAIRTCKSINYILSIVQNSPPFLKKKGGGVNFNYLFCVVWRYITNVMMYITFIEHASRKFVPLGDKTGKRLGAQIDIIN